MDLYEAAHGNLERVKLLVEQGIDKGKEDSNGSTPLYLASENGHLDLVQYLVEHYWIRPTAMAGPLLSLLQHLVI